MSQTYRKHGRFKNWKREQMPRKWREKADRECGGKTTLRKIWKERQEIGEQQQYLFHDRSAQCS